MSLTLFAHEDLAIAVVHTVEASLPIGEPTQTWESLACEVRRLFKIAIASAGERSMSRAAVVISAQRILDGTASMALLAETEADERRVRLTFSLEQCEAEAQRLFDAYIDGQQA